MIAKPRTRVVVFRVSQDEFGRLRDACALRGARTLSDFTRSELLDHLETEARDDRLGKFFREIEHRMTALQSEVANLTSRMEKYLDGSGRH